MLLHVEKIPVLADARQHVVEKVIELCTKAISDFNDLVSQSDLVLGEVLLNFVLHHLFSELYVLQTFLNFFLQRSFKIKFVHRVQGNNRMQQVIGIQAFCANLLLALQTKQDVVCRMESAFVFSHYLLDLYRGILSLLSFFEFADGVLNLDIF